MQVRAQCIVFSCKPPNFVVWDFVPPLEFLLVVLKLLSQTCIVPVAVLSHCTLGMQWDAHAPGASLLFPCVSVAAGGTNLGVVAGGKASKLQQRVQLGASQQEN